MILGPLIIVIFVVAFAVALARTRDALTSFAIAGAVAAAPVGAYFGGFWGLVIGAALGAWAALMIPGLAFVGAIGIVGFACILAPLYVLERIADSVGIPFQLLFYGVLVIAFIGMLLTAPISNRDRESVFDKIKNIISPAGKPNVEQLDALRSEPPPPDDHQVVSDLDDGDDGGQPEA